MYERLKMLEAELVSLKRGYVQQRRMLCALAILLASLGLAHFVPTSIVRAATTDANDGILHVRGLVVDDSSGHERLRLGAPLPDPMIHGKRVKRKGPISGLLISDQNGDERGGLVTDEVGEAFLGLDSEDEQEVLFLVNPKGGVNLDLYDSHGNEAALTVFPKGPRLEMKRARNTVIDLPQVASKP